MLSFVRTQILNSGNVYRYDCEETTAPTSVFHNPDEATDVILVYKKDSVSTQKGIVLSKEEASALISSWETKIQATRTQSPSEVI